LSALSFAFSFSPTAAPPDLHSFPTRRSSDLYTYLPQEGHPDKNPAISGGDEAWTYWPMIEDFFYLDPYNIARGNQNLSNPYMNRSEEHTSELQSREKLVCRLLLEKKKEKTRD